MSFLLGQSLKSLGRVRIKTWWRQQKSRLGLGLGSRSLRLLPGLSTP